MITGTMSSSGSMATTWLQSPTNWLSSDTDARSTRPTADDGRPRARGKGPGRIVPGCGRDAAGAFGQRLERCPGARGDAGPGCGAARVPRGFRARVSHRSLDGRLRHLATRARVPWPVRRAGARVRWRPSPERLLEHPGGARSVRRPGSLRIRGGPARLHARVAVSRRGGSGRARHGIAQHGGGAAPGRRAGALYGVRGRGAQLLGIRLQRARAVALAVGAAPRPARRAVTLMQAALGFRVKSGWATAVLLAGPARAPRVVDRRVIELSDPAVPTSRQPYHAVMGASRANGAKIEKRLRRVVERVTRQSVRQLLQEYRKTGHPVRRVALVVGSEIDPARIANDHIRAH